MSDTTAFYDFWRAWFAQPAEAKEPFRRVKGPCVGCGGQRQVRGPDFSPSRCPDCDGKGKINRGNWYPPGIESPGYSGKPDPKEYVHVGLKDSEADSPLWTGDVSAVFWDCYWAAVDWCMERGLADLRRAVRPEDCVLRILHYLPTADGLAGEAHRDFDLLTVNVGGTCPGLEVFEPVTRDLPNGRPFTAPAWTPREGGIHVGEMLEQYQPSPGNAQRLFTATPHRVRLSPKTERLAGVFFYNPPRDFVLRPGFTARDYWFAEPGERADGWVGSLVRAGTAEASKVQR